MVLLENEVPVLGIRSNVMLKGSPQWDDFTRYVFVRIPPFFTSSRNKNYVAPGVYVFTFSLPLPRILPPTSRTENGRIEYFFEYALLEIFSF